jgi:AraC-like DNA-binding protein
LFPEKPRNDQKRSTGDTISDVISYMRSKLNDILSIKEMALKSDLSISHFSCLFHKATGVPPLEYFIRLKLERACILLYDSDIKIKDIASMLGYEDPYYFSRLFKKYMDMSPHQYRRLKDNREAIKPKEWLLKEPESLMV